MVPVLPEADAVTVTVYVPAGVPPAGFTVVLEPPPHATLPNQHPANKARKQNLNRRHLLPGDTLIPVNAIAASEKQKA
jgi:hypothetical protein